MPVFLFKCPKCSKTKERLARKRVDAPDCPDCRIAMVRDNIGPPSQVIERIDTGTSSRPVERLQDAVELTKERAKKGPS